MQIRMILVRRQRALRNPQRQLRRTPHHHQRAEGLATHLLPNGVLEGSGTDIGSPLLHRLQGQGAGRKIAHRHVQTFRLEVAQLVGQRQRQVVEHALSAHGNCDVAQRCCTLCLRPHNGRRKHPRRRQGGDGAKGAAGEQGAGHENS